MQRLQRARPLNAFRMHSPLLRTTIFAKTSVQQWQRLLVESQSAGMTRYWYRHSGASPLCQIPALLRSVRSEEQRCGRVKASLAASLVDSTEECSLHGASNRADRTQLHSAETVGRIDKELLGKGPLACTVIVTGSVHLLDVIQSCALPSKRIRLDLGKRNGMSKQPINRSHTSAPGTTSRCSAAIPIPPLIRLILPAASEEGWITRPFFDCCDLLLSFSDAPTFGKPYRCIRSCSVDPSSGSDLSFLGVSAFVS